MALIVNSGKKDSGISLLAGTCANKTSAGDTGSIIDYRTNSVSVNEGHGSAIFNTHGINGTLTFTPTNPNNYGPTGYCIKTDGTIETPAWMTTTVQGSTVNTVTVDDYDLVFFMVASEAGANCTITFA